MKTDYKDKLAEEDVKTLDEVIAEAKKDSIIEKSKDNFVVSVKEPPVKGKANEAIRNALAVYFKTGSSCVKIISGYTSRNKIVEIN